MATFDFVKPGLERVTYIDAYNAIEELNLWDFMRQEHKSFMFPDKDLEIHDKLYNLVDRRGIHSGASYGCTMRFMEKIAKVGYEKTKEDYLAR